jgi:5S rRNA maturation endonuclease (ribonuclease M5)
MSKKQITIFVEGKTDANFLANLLSDWYGMSAMSPSNPWLLENEANELSLILGKADNNREVSSIEPFINKATCRNLFEKIEDAALTGIVLILVDADKSVADRRKEVITTLELSKSGLESHLFLFPDDEHSGELETLIESASNMQGIKKCWDSFAACFEAIDSKELLLNTEQRRKKLGKAHINLLCDVKELQYDLSNTKGTKQIWDANSQGLEPLKAFFDPFLAIKTN